MKRISNRMEKGQGYEYYKALRTKLDAQIPVIYRL